MADTELHEKELRWCPYPHCGFYGSDDQVDEHRANTHREEPQEGSNLTERPRY